MIDGLAIARLGFAQSRNAADALLNTARLSTEIDNARSLAISRASAGLPDTAPVQAISTRVGAEMRLLDKRA